jgi:uncharacterized protein YerC
VTKSLFNEAELLEFPKRVYTEEEVKKARELIEKGYRHRIKIKGSPKFKKEIKKAIDLIKTAGYYDFLRTYIRQIEEIEGFSQLHETDAVIWANMQMLEDRLDAASLLVQRAQQMKDYIEGRLYYGIGEISAIEKRLEFIKTLGDKSKNKTIKKRCEELLEKWAETKIMFP